MDVYVQGKKVRLTQAEFKAQGGQGAVYVKDGTAYKVYADPAHMIPPAKIAALSALALPDIVKPQDVLTDARRAPVGYTMPGIAGGFVLCQTFPRAFRDREGLTPDLTLGLVRTLQEGVAHVHAQNILIVDLNEMNFLVDPAFQRVFFLDVDSYQTPLFPATALMETVRDRHASAWNEGTDWFSFAVVSFQMFVGIHPYKGKHPALKTLDERMAHNVSVLNPDVSVPAACLPFGVIPRAWRAWYHAVLDCGQRCPPPQSLVAAFMPAAQAQRTVGSGLFHIEHKLDCEGAIVSYTANVIVTTQAVYVNGRRLADAAPGTKIGLSAPKGLPVAASLERGRMRLLDLTRGTLIPCDIAAEQLMAAEGRLYVKHGAALVEIGFLELPNRLLPQIKTVGAVLENATQLFEGVAGQNLLGAWYASLLAGRGLCHQVRLAELDGAQVLDARLLGNVLMVVAARAGRYEKLVFRFDQDFGAHDVRVIADVAGAGLNFAVLGSGVCLHLTDRDELEVFPAKKGASGLKVIADPALGGDCLLFHDGPQALLARGGTLSGFAMR